ncbi:hypothetical protein RISK_000224 [Rhodopirellula islandica]|uniref:Uncharacterized protein n=1 Tax=Rhodopirellula islandica TaxID=595434 RepID=A0A0J1BMK6_RHOIS|nr:hypothetical protein RISK_000224 [Rhodopirellula islandica]
MGMRGALLTLRVSISAGLEAHRTGALASDGVIENCQFEMG